MSVILGVFSLSIFPAEGDSIVINAGSRTDNLMDGLDYIILFYAIAIAVDIALLWMFILLVLPEWEFLSGKVGRGIFTAFFALSAAALGFSFFYITVFAFLQCGDLCRLIIDADSLIN
jgi:hypothetical protein